MVRARESPKGLGKVYRGKTICSRCFISTRVRGEAGELIRIGGYIQIVGGVKDQFRYDDEFTLRLDDGRQIDIVIKTWNFNSGEYLFADESAEE